MAKMDSDEDIFRRDPTDDDAGSDDFETALEDFSVWISCSSSRPSSTLSELKAWAFICLMAFIRFHACRSQSFHRARLCNPGLKRRSRLWKSVKHIHAWFSCAHSRQLYSDRFRFSNCGSGSWEFKEISVRTVF